MARPGSLSVKVLSLRYDIRSTSTAQVRLQMQCWMQSGLIVHCILRVVSGIAVQTGGLHRWSLGHSLATIVGISVVVVAVSSAAVGDAVGALRVAKWCAGIVTRRGIQSVSVRNCDL